MIASCGEATPVASNRRKRINRRDNYGALLRPPTPSPPPSSPSHEPEEILPPPPPTPGDSLPPPPPPPTLPPIPTLDTPPGTSGLKALISAEDPLFQPCAPSRGNRANDDCDDEIIYFYQDLEETADLAFPRSTAEKSDLDSFDSSSVSSDGGEFIQIDPSQRFQVPADDASGSDESDAYSFVEYRQHLKELLQYRENSECDFRDNIFVPAPESISSRSSSSDKSESALSENLMFNDLQDNEHKTREIKISKGLWKRTTSSRISSIRRSGRSADGSQSGKTISSTDDGTVIVRSNRNKIVRVSLPSKDGTSGPIVMERPSRRWKWITVILFLALALCLPSAVVTSYRLGEKAAFESDFKELSEQLTTAFGIKLARLLTTLDSLSVDATSHALKHNLTWPFVTLDDWDFKGANALDGTNAVVIAIYPIVQKDEREEWESYVDDNIGWLRQAKDRQYLVEGSWFNKMQNSTRRDRNLSGARRLTLPPFSFADGYFRKIFSIDYEDGYAINVDESDGPYVVGWQTYPLFPFGINFNSRSVGTVDRGINASIESQMATFGEGSRALGDSLTGPLQDYADAAVQRHIRDPTYKFKKEPVSVIIYPIFNNFTDSSDKKVVAFVSAQIFWPTAFNDIFPDSAGDLQCVVEDCGSKFTMEINGRSSTFLGRGDLHDSRLDRLEHRLSFNKTVELAKAHSTRSTVPLNAEHCPHFVRIFPTKKMEESYRTKWPIVFAVGSCIFFLLIAGAVSAYDIIMSRRFDRISSAAAHAERFVSTIFPANLKKKLYEAKKRRQSTTSTGSSPMSLLQGFLISKPPQDKFINLLESPIADFYPNCSLFFGYLDGFDDWSNKSEPHTVFSLLETIFQAFDRLARKRGVFKVETVGGSYVAVAGVPDPNPKHALCISKFARDAMRLTRKIMSKEIPRLVGADASLRLKIGLHSGPVTAGVLGGQKSRFQLFGDSMNFASRMATTSESNRIQVSSVIAKILMENHGDECWLEKRTGEVSVKGKGVVECYWLRTKAPPTMIEMRNANCDGLHPSALFPPPMEDVEHDSESRRSSDFGDSDCSVVSA